MRVTHVISGIDASLGGPVAALIGLARAQKEAGVEVVVAPSMPDAKLPATADTLSSAGISVQPVIGNYSPVSQQNGTREQLEPILQKSDVVHIYGLWESIQHETATLCRQLNKPYIFEPCGMLDEWSMRRSWLKKQLYMAWRMKKNLHGAAAIHACTKWECDQIAKLSLNKSLVVVPNGVELAEFKTLPQRGTFRARFPSLGDGPIIAFLGRIFPGKGLEMLIPALAKMKNRAAKLMVVGPDANGYEAEMRRRIAELKLVDRVVFTGMARGRERIEALVDADLFSLPSEHENFGVAVLEAMAAEKAVIVSDQVGLCHDIVQASAGEAVPLNADQLAASLDRWLGNESLRRDAGVRARALAFERFTWDLIAREWLDVYKQLSI